MMPPLTKAKAILSNTIIQDAGLTFLAQPGEEARRQPHELETEEDDDQPADAPDDLGERADVLAGDAGERCRQQANQDKDACKAQHKGNAVQQHLQAERQADWRRRRMPSTADVVRQASAHIADVSRHQR